MCSSQTKFWTSAGPVSVAGVLCFRHKERRSHPNIFSVQRSHTFNPPCVNVQQPVGLIVKLISLKSRQNFEARNVFLASFPLPSGCQHSLPEAGLRFRLHYQHLKRGGWLGRPGSRSPRPLLTRRFSKILQFLAKRASFWVYPPPRVKLQICGSWIRAC